jgi:hypothetical protein
VVRDLFRDQVLGGDLELLLLGIAGQLQDLHPVAQRGRDRIEHVGRRQEQHFGEIERYVEVVIAKRVVLFRVEDLEERRRGIAAEVGAQLVDFVEDEDRILRFRAPKALDDLPRQRSNVRATVTAYFRLVAHAAQ